MFHVNHSLKELENSVSRETISKLRTYQDLLVKWQRSINLVSPSTVEDSWNRHILDSLQVVNLIEGDKKSLMDLGCGGGFPGMVAAIARPELCVYLVESDQRKCSFMRAVSRETNSPATFFNQRIETLADMVDIPAVDVVSARALASLDKLLRFCRPMLASNPDLVCLFQKGIRHEEELLEARENFIFDCEVIASVIDADSVILRLTSISSL